MIFRNDIQDPVLVSKKINKEEKRKITLIILLHDYHNDLAVRQISYKMGDIFHLVG